MFEEPLGRKDNVASVPPLFTYCRWKSSGEQNSPNRGTCIRYACNVRDSSVSALRNAVFFRRVTKHILLSHFLWIRTNHHRSVAALASGACMCVRTTCQRADSRTKSPASFLARRTADQSVSQSVSESARCLLDQSM